MKQKFNPYLYQCYSGIRLAEFVLNEETRSNAAMPFIRRLRTLREFGHIDDNQLFTINRAEQVAMEELEKQSHEKAEAASMDNTFKDVHDKDHAAHIIATHEGDSAIQYKGDLYEVYAVLRKHLLDLSHDTDEDTDGDLLHDNHAIQCVKEVDQHIDNDWMKEAFNLKNDR